MTKEAGRKGGNSEWVRFRTAIAGKRISGVGWGRVINREDERREDRSPGKEEQENEEEENLVAGNYMKLRLGSWLVERYTYSHLFLNVAGKSGLKIFRILLRKVSFKVRP